MIGWLVFAAMFVIAGLTGSVPLADAVLIAVLLVLTPIFID